MPRPLLPFLARVALVAAALPGPRAARAEEGPRIVSIEARGDVDPPGRVQGLLAQLAPPGSVYLEAGPADELGSPISTPGRLRETLSRLGYDAAITTRPAPGGVAVEVQLRPYDRVRYIFVEGNWPKVRQDEVIRRFTLRPGQALPPAGPERDRVIEAERARVLSFLRSQGYREAGAVIELRGTDEIPSRVNLLLRLNVGPAYTLGPVVVRGNTALSSEEIAEIFRHRTLWSLWTLPAPFRDSTFQEDQRELLERYHELGYASVRVTYKQTTDPSRKEVRLELDINERKQIEVAFEGNRSVSDDRLKEQLTIFARQSYGDYEADSSARALAQFYRERGHMFVRTSWRRERVSAQVERLVFVVDEGPALKVRGVDFSGNQQVSSGALAAVVNVKEYPPLGFLGLGAGGYASLRQLQLDVDNLKAYYNDVGFPEADVSCEIAPAPGEWRPLGPLDPVTEARWRQARSLYVRFTIREGPLVRVGAIRFVSLDADKPLPRDDAFLLQLLRTTLGAPYQRGLLRVDGERLRRVMGDAGHPQATLEPETTRAGDQVTITWKIRLGPQVRIGEVFVRGNFLTQPDTILQWVRVQPGSVLTTTAFERSQRDLALIQLFNNASPISFPGVDRGDVVVPMLVEVEERHDHYGVVRVGGGASTEQALPGADVPIGAYASAGYEHRNLFGRGWTFAAQGSYGESLTRATATFVDPRFFGSLYRLELSATYLRQTTIRLGDLRSGGGSIGVAREVYPGVDAAVRYNLRDTFRTELLTRETGPGETQETVQIDTVVGSLSASLDWQRLDHPLVPTRGFRLSAGVEYAHPALSYGAGEDRFVKVGARAVTVVPLLGRVGLRHSLRYDHGFPIGAALLPKVERFFAGGDTTLRGFELDRARIEVLRHQYANVTRVEYRPVGGSLRLLQNVDLQFPIAPPWYGGVFLDSGVVADSFDGLGAARLRHGAGISPLVVRLPVGDISLSWGWPLDPGPGDSPWGRLHLNVGLMF